MRSKKEHKLKCLSLWFVLLHYYLSGASCWFWFLLLFFVCHSVVQTQTHLPPVTVDVRGRDVKNEIEMGLEVGMICEREWNKQNYAHCTAHICTRAYKNTFIICSRSKWKSCSSPTSSSVDAVVVAVALYSMPQLWAALWTTSSNAAEEKYTESTEKHSEPSSRWNLFYY